MKNMKAIGNLNASKQTGFTIIELVVVILLLGILTATALPRFLDVSTEAHNAVVDGVEGGLATGLALARAEWFATNQPNTLTSDFATLNVATSGYPVGSSGGADPAVADEHTECEEAMEGVLQVSGVVTVVTGATNAYPGYTNDTTGVVIADADLAAVAGAADFLAVLDSVAGQCEYWYIGDPTRATTATTPNLLYVPSSGAVTRTN